MYIKRGAQQDLIYRSNMVEIRYEIPLSEIIYDFFDTLKSASKGYASYDYDIIDYRESKMLRLDIHVNKKRWMLCHKYYIKIMRIKGQKN